MAIDLVSMTISSIAKENLPKTPQGISKMNPYERPEKGNVMMIKPTVLTKDTKEINKIVAKNEEAVKQADAKRLEETAPVVEKNATTVVSEPSFYEKNKNMIFIGAGIGAVVIIGAVVYFKMRKPTA